MAKKLGYHMLKIQNARGWPDRLLLTNDGRVVWIELKRPKGLVSPLQNHFHGKLQEMKFQVEVVRSAEEFKLILAGLRPLNGSHTTTSSEQSSG